MRMHRLVLMIVVPCLVVAGSRAVADEKPPKTQGSETATKTGEQSKPAGQNKELQALEKRVREEFLAECKENDRLGLGFFPFDCRQSTKDEVNVANDRWKDRQEPVMACGTIEFGWERDRQGTHGTDLQER